MFFHNITRDFLKSLAITAAKYAGKRSGAKNAYVCPEDLQYGMTRTWEVFLDSLPVETFVTRSMEEALKWITE